MCDFIYLCPVCGSCFSSETSLQEHDVAVHSSKNHACLMCRNALKDLTLLGRQVTAHKNLLHPCKNFGDLLENKVDFYIHVTSSHKYGGKMVCDFCSKTFSTDSNLKVHCIDEHAAEMSYVLQKYESFFNVHSSQKLEDCRLDVLKDSFNPSGDCALHPEEKGSRDKTNNPCDDSQSILLSEKVDGTGRLHGCQGPALTELQIFYQEQNDKDWYTTSTDHLSNIIQPNDILEQVQPFTENKKFQPIECSLCDMVFNNRNDYLLAHYRKDPSNVSPHKQKEKLASQVGLQDSVEFRKSSTGNTSPHGPSEKCVREEISGNETLVPHDDKSATAETENDQLEPDGTLLEEISTVKSQILKSTRDENQNDQMQASDILLAEIPVLTIQTQNKNASAVYQNDQLEPNGTLLSEMSTLTSQIHKNKSEENQNDQIQTNGNLLEDISALTIQNELDDAIESIPNKSLSDCNYST